MGPITSSTVKPRRPSPPRGPETLAFVAGRSAPRASPSDSNGASSARTMTTPRTTALPTGRDSARGRRSELALGPLPLKGFPLGQAVGDVVLVDVAHVRHRLATNLLRGHLFDVVEPHVGIESPLGRL